MCLIGGQEVEAGINLSFLCVEENRSGRPSSLVSKVNCLGERQETSIPLKAKDMPNPHQLIRNFRMLIKPRLYGYLEVALIR